MSTAAEKNLLFGLLALQNGLVDQSQLVAAFQVWTLDKSRSLADHLVARGDLDADDREAVTALAERHIKKHGGDLERSLGAVTAGHSTREGLTHLGDPQIDATLAHVGSRSTEDDADRTMGYSVATATAPGQRFRVLRPHAKGGLGAVFVALDAELNREVALKQILESHADDATSRQRFLLEAEITGGLEHPGIVPVYGLGTYSDGRPYYAMRFIKGDSLKQAIDQFHADRQSTSDPGQRSLALHQLLRRFVDVCNAVDYAHSRGVLHRDVKPGNIIVGRHGETLVVDWGLAKVTGRSDPSAGERTLVPSSPSGSADTLPGSALGTPPYMSPEQAEGKIETLGPRSDVYSLGATLYYLLTGEPPFAGEAADVIPRVRCGDFRPPREVDRSLDPALEAVCTHAMALMPDERYRSCKALADDVERWMADEPVTAWREPLLRRARRWAWQHRTPVAAAIVALLAGFIGLGVVASVQAHANTALRAANQETNRALADTQKAQAQTRIALKQSEESRQQAEAVSSFLVEAFRSPDPTQDGREVKVADVLNQAAEQLDKGFAGSPATRGALLYALAQTYRGLGLAERAMDVDTKALAVREAKLGPDHADTLRSRRSLADSFNMAGRLSEAIALYESTVRLQEKTLGTKHADPFVTRGHLAGSLIDAGRHAEAIALLESMIKKAEETLGRDDVEAFTYRNNLAGAYFRAGRVAEAIEVYDALLKRQEASLGPDHRFTQHTRGNLGAALVEAGRLDEAITLQERTLKLCEEKLGPDHPATLFSRSALATAYDVAGRLPEATALYDSTHRLQAAKLGADHPDTLITRGNLAAAYAKLGRLTESIALFESTLKLREGKLGPDHPTTLWTRVGIASVFAQAGRNSEALSLFETTVKRAQSKLGVDHPFTLWCKGALASVYESFGRTKQAEELYRDTLARRRAAGQPESLSLADDLAALGGNLVVQSRWSEAEPLLREGLAIRAKARPDAWEHFDAMSLLGAALLGQGRHREAESLIVAGYEGMKAREARITVPDRPRLRQAAERVVRLYEAWNNGDQATAWKAKVGMRDLPGDVFAHVR